MIDAVVLNQSEEAMTTTTEALRLAREALENCRGNINPERGFCDELECDIETALAALDAQPVAQPTQDSIEAAELQTVLTERFSEFRPAYPAGLYAWAKQALDAQEQQEPVAQLGEKWTPCVKLPVTVHVRKQRQGEKHISTREGITPVKPDDLIMRGIQGEEYPIGRELWEKTYTVGAPPQPAQPEPCVDGSKCKHGSWCTEAYCQEYCQFRTSAAPAGYVMVPVEPTQEMRIAGGDVLCPYTTEHEMSMYEQALRVYRAMIAAAPAQAKQKE
ncbi:MAG: hypothetical protein KGL39_36025 [Patescibacteria group bacterium]|nr:hypothetical protein [Patescibacteria group bacterium]